VIQHWKTADTENLPLVNPIFLFLGRGKTVSPETGPTSISWIANEYEEL
jgi:hypothetical protein